MSAELGLPPQQPFAFDDFSGGITDYYIGGPVNRYQRADNLLIYKFGNIGKLYTRPGSAIYDSTYSQIPAGSQRIGHYVYYGSVLYYFSANKVYYVNSGWQTLTGPSSNNLFPSSIDTTTSVSTATWNGHIIVASSDMTNIMKIYTDSGGTIRLRNAGLPELSAPTVTAGTAGSTYSYVYHFCLKFTYTVGSVTFIDRGPVTSVAVTSGALPSVDAIDITSIPVLTNSTTNNYDTSNIKVEIYRTLDGGTVPYYVGEITNGTTTYADSATDATILAANVTIYTLGGVYDNDPPPPSKYVHVVEDVCYYAHVSVGGEVRKNRCMQSIPGDIDSVPSTFYVDVDAEITGISSARGKPVLLCNQGAYRIDGKYDATGRGTLTAERIDDSCTCVSSLSVVQTQDGVFWAGEDGFYYTDGYDVVKISEHLDRTYPTYTQTAAQKRRIYGAYDRTSQRIWWTLQTETGGADDCDKCWILDLNFGVSREMPFTTASSETEVSNVSIFSPTALVFIGSTMIRGDVRGYTLKHETDIRSDAEVNASVAVASWNTATVIHNFTSMATNFGASNIQKRVPWVGVSCEGETNLSLQISTVRDKGYVTAPLNPIRSRGNLVWGDTGVIWGDTTYVWGQFGLINQKRRNAPRALRCDYMQVSLSNASVAIVSSDLFGTLNVNATAKTAVFNDTDFAWPTNIVGYYIAFDADDYTEEFLITGLSGDTITYQDALNVTVTDTTANFVVRGKPKNEILNLTSIYMVFSVAGMTQQHYSDSNTGEVGA